MLALLLLISSALLLWVKQAVWSCWWYMWLPQRQEKSRFLWHSLRAMGNTGLSVPQTPVSSRDGASPLTLGSLGR